LVDLRNPLMTEKAINDLDELMNATFRPNTDGLKNVLAQMKIDGLEHEIGSTRYPDYLIPFKQLIERELKQENQII